MIMGHPNLGLKAPSTHANGIWHSGRTSPQTRTPESFFRYGRPKTPSAHGPASRHDPLEASLAVEPPPPRSRALAGSSRSAGSLRLARGPLYRAPRKASARGDLRLARDHPRRAGTAAQPPDGTGRIYSSTTPRHRAGVSWRRLSHRTVDVIGVPSACADHCTAIPGAGQGYCNIPILIY